MNVNTQNTLEHAIYLKTCGEYEACLSALKNALEIFEIDSYDHKIVLYELGLLNIQLGNFDEADQYLNSLGFKYRL